MTITIPQPGSQVRVVQVVDTRDGKWETVVEGEVVTCLPAPTGSWYAHGKDDRFWLQRLRLRRADGELIDLIVDEGTRITVL